MKHIVSKNLVVTTIVAKFDKIVSKYMTIIAILELSLLPLKVQDKFIYSYGYLMMMISLLMVYRLIVILELCNESVGILKIMRKIDTQRIADNVFSATYIQSFFCVAKYPSVCTKYTIGDFPNIYNMLPKVLFLHRAFPNYPLFLLN